MNTEAGASVATGISIDKPIVGKIGIVGDIHLSSKNYGAHRNYPVECMEYFRKITELTDEHKLTHLIGTGDLTYGRFHTLEFRQQVEQELNKQYSLVKGNRYELKGNHDISSSMTERDFYVHSGLIKPSANISIGNVNITMVDYGLTNSTEVNETDTGVNVIIAHDFYKFSYSKIANFGKAIELDTLEKWIGADILICGHVHKIMEFEGYVTKGDTVHKLQVYYPGCMTRPSYREGYLDEQGQFIIITVYADGEVDINKLDVPLWKVEDSFNLEVKAVEKQKKVQKAERVDISDVVKQLDTHDRSIGNPEDIIEGLDDIEPKYKNKAIELLKRALE